MQYLKSGGALAAVVLWSALAAVASAATGEATHAGPAMWARTAFVIGAPGRLDSDGDRRAPRLYQRSDSAIAAYVDVEVVQDATWLRHEIEHYARRVVDCTGLAPEWCRRRVHRIAAGSVIDLAFGTHAELVWLSGTNRAVRLGWRRIVDTTNGTMTVDAPPIEFATDVLSAFPSRSEAFDIEVGIESGWRAAERDRLLYYADQVVAALPSVVVDVHRRHAIEFVEDALAQIERLGGSPGDARPPERLRLLDIEVGSVSDALPAQLADQLDAVRGSSGAARTPAWCALELSSVAALP